MLAELKGLVTVSCFVGDAGMPCGFFAASDTETGLPARHQRCTTDLSVRREPGTTDLSVRREAGTTDLSVRREAGTMALSVRR